MSELVTEYFTCKICKQNISVSHEEMSDIPTVCNGCWLNMEPWQRYEDSDLKNRE